MFRTRSMCFSPPGGFVGFSIRVFKVVLADSPIHRAPGLVFRSWFRIEWATGIKPAWVYG
jgi:hypothetical protein